MQNLLRTWLCVFGLAVAGVVPADAAAPTPVVVELFTSQGCSSCPPADDLLGDLTARDDVLGLSFHVDYWDHIGWKDPYADPDHGHRQRRYARRLGERSVYTPQMVIHGLYSEVGSRRGAVLDGIARARDATPDVPVALSGTAGGLRVRLPAVDGLGRAEVLAVMFDETHRTRVRRGENRGRVLTNINVVRALMPIGVWDGGAAEFVVPADWLADRGDACAVLVQEAGQGRILGAAWTRVAEPR